MARLKDPLPGRIRAILRAAFPEDTIDVSPSGIRENIHVIVVSRALDGKTERKKQEYVWDLLESGGLTKSELARISLILPISIEELKR